MGLFCSKPDEKHKQIVDLPPEMIRKIFTYIGKKERMKISLVNKQWYAIINTRIDEILIRSPTQDNLNQVKILINRFPRLKNLELNVELATEVNHCLDFLPLASLAFFGIQLEFVIEKSANPDTHISRIRINLEDFNFKSHPSQVLTFEINRTDDFEKLKEDIMSFNCVTKIQFFKNVVCPFEFQRFAKIIECILTRKQLKEIELGGVNYFSYLDYENIFPKNLTVEEISLWSLRDNLSSKIWIKMFDALPNIKAVRLRVVGTNASNVVMI